MSSECRIIGVTVGVGLLHAKLAKLAATCFTTHTGLPVAVLGPDELAHSGLVHPAALRLRAFDYVDADVVVYFDSDWLCLNPWSPALYARNRAFIACRDFILQSEWPEQRYDYGSSAFKADGAHEGFPIDGPVRDDYISQVAMFAGLNTGSHRWINTGLFIAHRQEHESVLSHAVALYGISVGHHPEYYEQPALNKAIEATNTRLLFLSRKHNVLAAYERIWDRSVIGLHAKMKRHGTFIAKLNTGQLTTAAAVRHHFLNE